MKKNLVVVRAGGKSLHTRWTEIPHEDRNYDLLISYFSDEAFAAFQPEPGVEAVLIKGGKWDGLFATLSDRDLDAYDFYWLPDDDLDISAKDVNALFDAMNTHGLRIAQPSLSPESYFSHFVFSQCPGFVLRYTNYIEIMAPLPASGCSQEGPAFVPRHDERLWAGLYLVPLGRGRSISYCHSGRDCDASYPTHRQEPEGGDG